MANYNIYDKNGTLRYAAKAVKFSASFMQVATLTVTVKSALPIAFAIGDYIDYSYDGLRYTIRETPTPKKVARYDTVTSGGVTTRQGLYGEAFQYELVFKSALWELKNCQFKDYVLNEQSGLRYTSLPDVSTYENPTGIKNRILANVNKMKSIDTSSISTWAFKFHDTDGSATLEAKDFSLSNGSCLDAMAQMYELWKISFRHIVENVAGVPTNTIVFSKVVTVGTISTLFKYGLNQGLKALKKTIQNGDEIYTRIFAFGNTTNLSPRYYNTVKNQDGTSLIADTMYIPHLMLPPSSWGTKPNGNPDVDKAFYYDPNNASLVAAIAKFGIRPKAIYFDGTDGREDIYPSLKKKITSGTSITDDGTLATDTKECVTIKTGSESNNASYDLSSQTASINQSINHQFFPVTLSSTDIAKGNQFYLKEGQPFYVYVTTQEGTSFLVTDIIFKLHNGSSVYTLKTKIEAASSAGGYARHSPYYTDGDIILTTGLTYIEVVIKGIFPSWEEQSSNTVTAVITDGTRTISVYMDYVHKKALSTDRFNVTLSGIDFDIMNQAKLAGNTAKLAMLDGACGGWSFDIINAVETATANTWVITCKRCQDETLGTYYPNSNFQIAANDNYTLTDICMPESYIHTAEQRLLQAVQALAPWEEKFVIEPEIDNIKLARSPQTLSVGMWMQVLDDDLELGSGNTPTYILIDSLTIDDSGTDIPKFSVTLRDEKPENTITKALKSARSNSESLEKAQRTYHRQSTKSDESSAEGTNDHSLLTNRFSSDQHSIESITDLEDELEDRPKSEDVKKFSVSFNPNPSPEEGEFVIVLTNDDSNSGGS